MTVAQRQTPPAPGSGESQYRLIFADRIAWQPTDHEGVQVKTLIDHGLGRLLLALYRFDAGAVWHPPVLASLVVDGEAVIAGETLTQWDFAYLPQAAKRSAVSFPRGGSMLTVTMREIAG